MKKSKKRRNSSSNPLLPLLAVLGGFVLILGGAYALWSSQNSSAPKAPVEVKGAPSLKVDREQVDLGDIPLDKTVSVTFQLTNVGDQTLRFSEQPFIEVLEGC